VDGFTTGLLAWGLRIGFYLGVVLAALFVRRGSIFTAMVQPPLVLVIGIVLLVAAAAMKNTSEDFAL